MFFNLENCMINTCFTKSMYFLIEIIIFTAGKEETKNTRKFQNQQFLNLEFTAMNLAEQIFVLKKIY